MPNPAPLTREEIEHAMLKVASSITAQTTGWTIPVTDAVSVTEALLREQRERWGHSRSCYCHFRDGADKCQETTDDYGKHQHPHRDPDCAPQESHDEEPKP